MLQLRNNIVKHKLAEGDVATVLGGPMTSNLIELFGPLKFDGIWIEMEHGPVDYRDIPNFTRACDLWGKTSIARVNLNLPGVIYRTLDLGAQGIVVPHVNTAGEAAAAVEAAKHHPMGMRGCYTGRQSLGVDNYELHANAETMVIVLIEDIVAIENLSEILKVDHIDVFFVATGDLSQSMGLLGQSKHPDVIDVATSAVNEILAAGRVAGAVVDDSNLERYLDQGVRFLMADWDSWVMDGANAYLKKVASASA